MTLAYELLIALCAHLFAKILCGYGSLFSSLDWALTGVWFLVFFVIFSTSLLVTLFSKSVWILGITRLLLFYGYLFFLNGVPLSDLDRSELFVALIDSLSALFASRLVRNAS